LGLTLLAGVIHRARPQFVAARHGLVAAGFLPGSSPGIIRSVPQEPPAAPENEMNTIRCYDRYTHVKRLAVLVGVAAGIALGLLAR
jgi:hypothetical protein